MPDCLQTAEEFGDIIVRTNSDGSQVRISDVANVELGVETYLAYTRMDKEECATLIPTLAIPVSLVGAFVLFPMLGFTINTLSLLGLVLAIGIVVDDAIVLVYLCRLPA